MGRSIRSFTLDNEVSHRIDEFPRGQRSEVVNRLLHQALADLDAVQIALAFSLSVLVFALTLMAAPQVL